MRRQDIDERVVAQAWERQDYSQDRLNALCLHVIFRGVPSDAGGPDYQDAFLALPDGKIQSGDIEFHVVASDWLRHGHNTDPRYNNVILHVVWRNDDAATFTESGKAIPILEIGVPRGSQPGLDRQAVLTEHPCVAAFAAVSNAELAAAICEAGQERFDQKADIFAAELSASDPSQVAYRAILASLGFASNRSCFEALSEVAPYGWLQSVPKVHWKDVLLCAAGFARSSPVEPPARLRSDQWRLVRIRPPNHPARRLVAVAQLLAGTEGDLARAVVQWVQDSDRPVLLRRRLQVTCSDGSAIGSGRADEIAVNAVLPFVAAMDANDGAARSLFALYPSPPANRWTRLMVSMMRDAGQSIAVKRAIQHQGLHALYHGHCRYERRTCCLVCGPRGSPL